MTTFPERALVEVHRDAHDDLVVTSATAAAEALLGAPVGGLRDRAWAEEFAAGDASALLDGCHAVLRRERAAWNGVVATRRTRRRLHLTVTRPVGSLRPRLYVELAAASACCAA